MSAIIILFKTQISTTTLSFFSSSASFFHTMKQEKLNEIDDFVHFIQSCLCNLSNALSMISLSLLSIKYTWAYSSLYSSLQFLMRGISIAYSLKIFTFSVFFHNERYLSMSFDITLTDN